MSIRIIALYILVVGLSIYAWKDWFKSLCGLILMMVVLEHNSMPRGMLGFQGLNMWNVLFVMIFLAWLASRQREGLVWDMPRRMNILLLLYLAVIVFGLLRAALDRSNIPEYPLKSLIGDHFINTVKWVLPGALLFDGCRTRRRVILVLVCILSVYFLISIQIIRFMPLAAALGDEDVLEWARISLGRYMNYTAVNISAMLAGASWAILAALPLARKKKYQILLVAAAGAVTLGQALSGGRAGILAWGGTGLLMCLLKWRRYLLLAPLVVILLPIVFPAAAERMLMGFGEVDAAGETAVDEYEFSSGRLMVWPYVIDKIMESPLVGYGRLAMQRTGLTDQLISDLNEAFGHPHNMYLETLLDNGVLGSLPIFLFFGMVIVYSARLFRSSNRLYSAVGGLALALTLAQLIAGIGAQHVYPRSITLGWWAAMFLMLRIHVEERQAQEAPQAEVVADVLATKAQREDVFARAEEAAWQ
ncbi:MAG: O-antigen ligase family protein [Sedimentisphaerales bacterium]|nr:O-antigen ligase family protein [Sedimentisphaerales bacterium]